MAVGPFGITMNQPVALGSVAEQLPDNQSNRGSSAAVLAWGYWRQFLGVELQNCINDLQNIPND